MIYIDFQGGAHGNYLDYTINKIFGVETDGLTPFTTLGTSHNKRYKSKRYCFCGHYSYRDGWDGILKPDDKIVSIHLNTSSVLNINQITLDRAGDFNITISDLHRDTYNKFKNSGDFRELNDLISQKYILEPLLSDYQSIKAETWPCIKTVEDFYNLPAHILDECTNTFGISPLTYNEENADCPTIILYDIFYNTFMYPETNGFIVKQNKVAYDTCNNVFYFDYMSFYRMDAYLTELDRLTRWLGIDIYDVGYIKYLHNEFLSRQPYKNTLEEADQTISQIINGEHVSLRHNIIQQAYIDVELEKKGNTKYFYK